MLDVKMAIMIEVFTRSGKTQAELARKLGWSSAYISRLIKGVDQVTEAKMQKILRVIGGMSPTEAREELAHRQVEIMQA